MLRYIARRLLLTVPILLVITVATFTLMSLVIGDPVLLILGPEANADPATIARLRQQLGVNRPLPVQYLDWLRHVLTGDFGRSFRSPISVRDAVFARVPVTLELAVLALLVALAAQLRPWLVEGPRQQTVRRILSIVLALVAIWLLWTTRR